VQDRERSAISVGGAEHFALPAAYPGLREVNVYLGGFGPLARPLQAGTLLSSAVTRVPGAKSVMAAVGERLVDFVPAVERGTISDGASWVVGQAFSADDEQLAEVHLSGDEPYAFTGGFMAWAARRIAHAGGLAEHGALGPVSAFGLDALVEGADVAGLRRVVV
jgi:hypothetical protein